MRSRLASIISLLAFGLLLMAACQPANTPSPTRTEPALAPGDTPTRVPSLAPSPALAGMGDGLIGMSKLFMQTENDGWAIDSQAGRVFHTTNAGRVWQDVTPPGTSPVSNPVAEFLDTGHAWLVVAPQGGSESGPTPKKITIYITNDAGQNWQNGDPIDISGGGPAQLFFVDPLHGWMLADLGAAAGSQAVEIFRTLDGGLHWESISLTSGYEDQSTPGSLPFSCSKNGLAFRDPSTGWAGGSCPGDTLFLFQTQDGGQTWQRQALPLPPNYPEDLFSNCMCDVLPPEFVTAQDGFLTVKVFEANQEAFVYATHDGGGSWEPFKLPTPQFIDRPVFVDTKNGWVSDGNQLYQTQDGGQTWRMISSLPPPDLAASLDFATSQDGWYTDGDQLYITHDSGRTWSILP